MLLELRDRHNTILVVEHSRQIIALADHIIELGPLAGARGGEIVYEGDLAGLRRRNTLTAKAMNRKIQINQTPFSLANSLRISSIAPV